MKVKKIWIAINPFDKNDYSLVFDFEPKDPFITK